MYTNKHAWTNKDGTYKEVYYYICGRNKQERGHHCDYKASLRKTDIEPLVIEAVKELVSDKYFAKEIEKRIGVQTDTTAIDKELANYESKLKEVDLNKARLEREIDNLPVDTRFRERKIHDMTLRLDALYDTIVELEERIEDAKLRKSSIEMETITLDNIYKLMLNFGKLYDIISDEEKKSLITYLIKEIQIYPNGESEQPLKSIEFNFPIYRDGQEVRRLLWEKGNTVDTVTTMTKLPHPTIQKFGAINVVIVGASRRFLAQITRHQNEVKFMSASLQYSDYSDDAAFAIPYEVMARGEEETYLTSCKLNMANYAEAVKQGLDNDAAGYMAPQGLRNVLLISATPYQWKHIIGQRTCRRNTSETRLVLLKVWDELYKLNPLLFSRATTGPFCMRGACKEGKMGCKNPMPYLTPSELLRLEFPLLYEEGGAGNAG